MLLEPHSNQLPVESKLKSRKIFLAVLESKFLDFISFAQHQGPLKSPCQATRKSNSQDNLQGNLQNLTEKSFGDN